MSDIKKYNLRVKNNNSKYFYEEKFLQEYKKINLKKSKKKIVKKQIEKIKKKETFSKKKIIKRKPEKKNTLITEEISPICEESNSNSFCQEIKNSKELFLTIEEFDLKLKEIKDMKLTQLNEITNNMSNYEGKFKEIEEKLQNIYTNNNEEKHSDKKKEVNELIDQNLHNCQTLTFLMGVLFKIFPNLQALFIDYLDNPKNINDIICKINEEDKNKLSNFLQKEEDTGISENTSNNCNSNGVNSLFE